MSRRYPALHVDLGLLEENARALKSRCLDRGVTLTAVTKLTASHPALVRALWRGGITSFADSHLVNLKKIRRTGLPAETMLIRAPMAAEIPHVPRWADICCAGDLGTLRALDEAAASHGTIVKVLVMIELGNLREGIMPEEALPRCREIARLKHLKLYGLGTIFGCLSAVGPTWESLERLAALGRAVERDLGIELPLLSGGSGSNLRMLVDTGMPEGVNHLRLGEAFFNGVEALHREPLPWLSQDVFRFEAEILEASRKPSVVKGEPVMDAFGRYTTFEDRGTRWRLLLATGRHEVSPEDLAPLDGSLSFAGATSDQMVLDAGAGADRPRAPGDIVAFRPAYSAVLGAFNSPHVSKVFRRGGGRG